MAVVLYSALTHKRSDDMKIIAFILAASMILSLVSCSNTEIATTGGVQEDVASEAETDAVTGREEISDDLPEKDYQGKEFRIITPDYCEKDFLAESETGALVSDAVFRRNQIVSERYNIKLSPDCTDNYTVVSGKVKSAVLSGDDAYDLVLQHQIDLASFVSNKFFYDWNDISYINVEKPWWNYSSYKNLSIAGKSYMIIGSISPYFLGAYYCVYFNKQLAADYGVPDNLLYDIVLDGKFTIDYYISLIRDTWRDLNGNGKHDENDFYGLAAQVTSYATPFIYSFGEVTVTKNKDDIPELSMKTEKFADIVNKVYTLFYDSNGTITTSGWELHTKTFLDSRAIFFNGVFQHSYNYFTDFEDDYGMLPYPKWDESQKKYYTMSDGSSPLAAVPATVQDTEYVGIITEALAAESWKKVIPKIYDVALKVRGARDEQSLTVIDMIANSAILDFGFVFGEYSGMGFTLSNLMERKSNNFASYYANNVSAWEKRLEKITEQITQD